jgi:hypothetical protein
MARQNGQSNVIDGRVRINHPEGTGYDDVEAGRQMEETFTKILGPSWRKDFEYSDFFEENLIGQEKGRRGMDKITIVTVDNGWGIPDFIKIVSKLENVCAIVMKKGVVSQAVSPGVETIPYEPSLDRLLKEADMALFTKVGEANKEEYIRLLKAGIPTVVHAAFAQGLIEHEKNGFIYQDEPWATNWLNHLRDKENAKRIRDFWAEKRETASVAMVEAKDGQKRPKVTVITPTYKRDLKVIYRCVSCMLLQTMKEWEQIVCSDGNVEPEVQKMIESLGDPRVRYAFTTGKKEGDFGNTVRLTMMKNEAKGDHILFCDDDNIILPHYMRMMVDAIERSGSDFAVCRIMHFGPLNEAEVGKPPKVLTGEPVKLYHVDPLQVMVRKEVMLKVGWDTEVGYLSDGVTLEKLGKDFKHVTVGEVLGIHM